MPKTPAGKQHKAQRGALKSRLREARLTLHRIKFLLGDVYHVLGGVHSTSEDAAYEVAEQIRRDLLKGVSACMWVGSVLLTLLFSSD